MSLLLKWQPREATLTPAEADNQSAEAAVARIEFDFELSPLVLISEKSRTRLVQALSALRSLSASEDNRVDLLLPPRWGVTLEVPAPGLPDDQLEEHLLWELGAALLGRMDQYRYGWDERNGAVIHLTALRIKLCDLIALTLQEAGFHLSGLYLDEEGFSNINLGAKGQIPEAEKPKETEARIQPIPPAVPEPEVVVIPEPEPEIEIAPLQEPEFKTELEPAPEELAIEAPVQEFDHISELPHKRSSRGFLIAVAAIILLAVVGIKLFTNTKRPAPPVTTRQLEMAAAESTLTAQETLAEDLSDSTLTATTHPDSSDKVAQEALVEPNPGELASMIETRRHAGVPMTRRLQLWREFLEVAGEARTELVSFTQERFIFRFSAPDSSEAQTVLARLQAWPDISTLKLISDGTASQESIFLICGHFKLKSEATASIQPNDDIITALAKKHGLTSEALAFTGSKANIMAFLDEISSSNYAFYRVIYIPWDDQESRLALNI
jgi:hypothetical protein